MAKHGNRNLLNEELRRRKAMGCERLTVTGMGERFRALGYRLDRSADCWCMAKYITGSYAGETHPCITCGVVELDTGRSAFHFESRRDANFEAMQQLRQDVFAVTRRAILEA